MLFDRFVSALFWSFVGVFVLCVFLLFGDVVAHAEPSAGPFDCPQSFDPEACEMEEAANAYGIALRAMYADATMVLVRQAELMDLCERAGYDMLECEQDWNAAAEWHYTREE